MPYNHMMPYYPFAGFWSSLIWLIAIIVIAYLVYKLVKSEKIFTPAKPPVKNAEDILAERYAKGEITREQFMQMKEDIKKPTQE